MNQKIKLYIYIYIYIYIYTHRRGRKRVAINQTEIEREMEAIKIQGPRHSFWSVIFEPIAPARANIPKRLRFGFKAVTAALKHDV